MKINLNIKGKKKFYQKLNLPIIFAFLLSVVMAFAWLYLTYSSHCEYSAKIKELEEQIRNVKTVVSKKAIEKSTIENKQFIDSNVFLMLNQKIQFLSKFTGGKKSAFNFFQTLEQAVTGEIFISNIISEKKNNDFVIEGSSSNADNISELVKKIQSSAFFSKVELKQINGGNASDKKTLNFSVALSYLKEPLIEFDVAAFDKPKAILNGNAKGK